MFSLLAFLLFGLAHCRTSSKAGADCDTTGQVVNFEVTFTWEEYSANGQSRMSILTNGQLPGPPLHAQVGDNILFTAINSLPFATSVHFHGITQLGTPWSDGVPGLSQKPIPAGEKFLYNFTLDESGQYFYHAHDNSQVMDGLFGAIIIDPPEGEAAPWSLISDSADDITAMEAAMRNPIPVMISDWSHLTSQDFQTITEASQIDIFCVDSILINGKGSRYCQTQDEINALETPPQKQLLNGTGLSLTATGCLPFQLPLLLGGYPHDLSAVPPDVQDVCTASTGPTEIIQVDPSQVWVSLNFIGVQSIQSTSVSIDNHAMWIYAVDGRYIVPQQVDAVALANAYRYSVMVKLDQPVGDYTIRAAGNTLVQIVSGFATLSYTGSAHDNNSTASITYTGTNATESTRFLNDSTVAPFVPEAVPASADETYMLQIQHGNSAVIWTLSANGQSYFAEILQLDNPFLFQSPATTASQWPNNTISTTTGHWVDLIVIADASTLQPPHAMHKHSNKFFIIGEGSGPFPYSTVDEAVAAMPAGTFNFVNPQLRDTYTTLPVLPPAPTWMVLRYQVVNPGAFLFHCHIQTHLAAGLAIAMLDGVDQWPVVPDVYLNGNGI